MASKDLVTILYYTVAIMFLLAINDSAQGLCVVTKVLVCHR